MKTSIHCDIIITEVYCSAIFKNIFTDIQGVCVFSKLFINDTCVTWRDIVYKKSQAPQIIPKNSPAKGLLTNPKWCWLISCVPQPTNFLRTAKHFKAFTNLSMDNGTKQFLTQYLTNCALSLDHNQEKNKASKTH